MEQSIIHLTPSSESFYRELVYEFETKLGRNLQVNECHLLLSIIERELLTQEKSTP
ncbi:hypothetical protein Q9251_14510 [Alkalihalobacillus macyae]|uniref:hypothetical protein n=1 Tax=Guptibacillus hwajinpoensis TaxID=208199 RepID=UPI00273C6544|nr:hypothetical protein [Alkalihalobacillus macyae]MDP4552088.1 hypothetical protein [Alkalihalobacillus macyae]